MELVPIVWDEISVVIVTFVPELNAEAIVGAVAESIV